MTRVLQRPALSLPPLLAIALAIEMGQYFPEVFVGAHALGEVTRNLCYALIGGVVFQWLVVEIPSKRRREATYQFNRNAFQLLLITGPGLLSMYQQVAGILNERLDVWDEGSLAALSKKIAAVDLRGVFGPDRAGLLLTTVDVGVPRALAELAASASYLDLDVAHALSQFPSHDGLNVLQVQKDHSGCVLPHSDVHITWSLLEAARRLYAALLTSGAYGPEVFEGYAGEVRLSADVLVRA